MPEPRNTPPRYSVIVPVGERADDLPALITEYMDVFESAGESYELIVVFDGPRPEAQGLLTSAVGGREGLRVIELTRAFGESAALMAGFDSAAGDMIVTLPAYYQVDAGQIAELLAAAGEDDDMLVAVRWPRAGSWFDRWRRQAFHWLFAFVSRMRYRDLGCGVRLLKREVAEEISLYGDQHRFLPALASRSGFQVREVELAQSPRDRFRGHYRLREYLHRLLDILTVFFLVRFTKKPLRFFGTIGSMAAGVGGLFVIVLVFQRLVFDMALADRPALLLASLLVVLGVQMMALGLIGELIIFTHASQMKEYAIRSIVDHSDASAREEPRGRGEEAAVDGGGLAGEPVP